MGVYGGQPKWFSRLTWEFLTHLGEVLSDNEFDLEAKKRAAAIDSSQVLHLFPVSYTHLTLPTSDLV